MNEVNILEKDLVEMMDTMIGCACSLNSQNYDTLIKTREEFKSVIHEKLYKISN